MSIALGYDYDEVQLKRDCYRPEAHVSIEKAQLDVLSGLADVLQWKRPFPVAAVPLPAGQDSNSQQKGTSELPATDKGEHGSS